jgi:RNA polymerase sigma-70 factor (ECF subfamily)
MDALFARPHHRSAPPPSLLAAKARGVSDALESPEATPEAHLAAIAAHGDRQAFAALFQHFAPRVRLYLVRSGCEPGMAEELVQEAMLAVWRKARQFDPARAGAGAWIFAIARNLRVDALRRRRVPTLAADLADPPSDEPGPDQRLAGLQAAAQLRLALADLPPEQSEVIQAAYYADRPHSEIAAQLGLPLGTVKSRLRLALQRLRAQFERLQ